jgi:DNA-binding MarR family transcriptional regulator
MHTRRRVRNMAADGGDYLEKDMAFVLRSAAISMERLCQRLLRPLGITFQQYIVLSALWARDGLSCGVLALRLGVNASSASRAIKRLETAGLVRRERCASDERSVNVWLTSGGANMHSKTGHLRARLAALSEMTDDDLASLQRMVQRFECESSRLG